MGPASVSPNTPAELTASVQDKHTSTLVMANLETTGHMCLGAFMAGLVVQLAHLPGHAYTTFLCLFTALGLIPFAFSRARYGSHTCFQHSSPVFCCSSTQ